MFYSQHGQEVLKCPNWHWDPPSLLFSGFQGHFVGGGWQDMKVHFYLAPRLKKNAAKPLISWILHSVYTNNFSLTFIYCENVLLVLGKQIHVCCNSIKKKYIPYFPAHTTHCDFFVRNFRKKNDECILILVLYWKKTGLLHTKISNHNIIYSS
jgi:hypothetical protein